MDIAINTYLRSFFKLRGLNADFSSPQPLQGDGSTRVFYRFSHPDAESSYIFMAHPPIDETAEKENFSYLMIGRHLFEKGISVPKIYQFDLKQGWFIMEDLGSVSLQDAASAKGDPMPIYKNTLKTLLKLQTRGPEKFKPEWCCQTYCYNRHVMRQFESDYFKTAFLQGYLGLETKWPGLETAFDFLAESASRADSCFFLHRDFQSRNIMVRDRHIRIIDWQGARIGPLGYDLASLLIDPYARLTPDQRDGLFQTYRTMLRKKDIGQMDTFCRTYPYLAIQRNLQILGAFAFLTKTRHKYYFESYIPYAFNMLKELLRETADPALGPLRNIVNERTLPHEGVS